MGKYNLNDNELLKDLKNVILNVFKEEDPYITSQSMNENLLEFQRLKKQDLDILQNNILKNNTFNSKIENLSYSISDNSCDESLFCKKIDEEYTELLLNYICDLMGVNKEYCQMSSVSSVFLEEVIDLKNYMFDLKSHIFNLLDQDEFNNNDEIYKKCIEILKSKVINK